MEKENMWLVMFYAPWCGHCRVMEPTWLEVGATFHKENSDVKVGRIDATKLVGSSRLQFVHFGSFV